MKIVAVTSCITGIAHTYMAAEALEQAAKKNGYEIRVETQGSAGSSPIPQSFIDEADVVIFAADLEVKQKNRFNGKPVLRVGVAKALSDAASVIAEAVKSAQDGTAEIVGSGDAAKPAAAPKAAKPEAGEKKKGFLGKLFG
ncbi:MAG: PTS fructose transporter subunit IIB [Agromyces sp.]